MNPETKMPFYLKIDSIDVCIIYTEEKDIIDIGIRSEKYMKSYSGLPASELLSILLEISKGETFYLPSYEEYRSK